MQVTKRNGRFEDVSLDKVLRRIKCLAEGRILINPDQQEMKEPSQTTTFLHGVDPVMIAQQTCMRLCDKISTSDLDEFAASACVDRQTENLDYGVLASRIIISNNHKNTSDTFSGCIEQLASINYIGADTLEFIRNNKDTLDNAIVHSRDYDFDYFSFKTLEKSYLLKVNKVTVERIQYMFMRVSCGIHGPNLSEVIKSYNYMSQKYFTHATPTLFNAGTHRPQLFSCFLTAPEDSIAGIYKWISDMAKISKEAGGIGGSIGCIRGEGAFIHGTNNYSDGLVPMLRVVKETIRYVNQGGRRNGSAAMYLQPHHPDIMQFLQIRLNNGNEERRCRNLFTGMFIPDHFMHCVEKDKEYHLFHPNECPGLDTAVGDEYVELYERYFREGKAVRSLPARDIWNAILRSQIETGAPYMLYKDACNIKNNQKNLGTIVGSNLCCEILEYHDEKEYACCCLSSICLPSFIDPTTKKFDLQKLANVAGQIVRNLNQVIDRNMYPVPETKLSNMRHRPLGIGVQGLADVFCQLRYPFDSPEAAELNKEIFAAIYYGSMKASMELAKESTPYETFQGSPLSQGKFQFDLWSVTPSETWDWEKLRKDVMTHGVRNSLLTACMPTASTSQIMGFNECFEPFTSNLYTRRTMSGEIVVINKYLVRDLEKLGLWNIQIKDEIIANNGSIQMITQIPRDIRRLYKTSWELSQKILFDLSAGRGPYICQTQSLNLFFKEPTYKQLSSAHFYAWRKGLKTGSYYIRSRPASQAQQFTIDPLLKKKKAQVNNSKPTVVCTEEVCTACSG